MGSCVIEDVYPPEIGAHGRGLAGMPAGRTRSFRPFAPTGQPGLPSECSRITLDT